jgi:hypothetical protein
MILPRRHRRCGVGTNSVDKLARSEDLLACSPEQLLTWESHLTLSGPAHMMMFRQASDGLMAAAGGVCALELCRRKSMWCA